MVAHNLATHVFFFLLLSSSVFAGEPPPTAPRPRSYISRTLLLIGASLCTQQAIIERAKARLLTEEDDETDSGCSSSSPSVSLPASAKNATGTADAAAPATQSRPEIVACSSPTNVTGSIESSECQHSSSGVGGENNGEQPHSATTAASATTTHSGTIGKNADAMTRSGSNEDNNADGFVSASVGETEFDPTSATTRTEPPAEATAARSRVASVLDHDVSSSDCAKASDRMEAIDNVTPNVLDADASNGSIGDEISEATRISLTDVEATGDHVTVVKMENVRGAAKLEVTSWIDAAMLSVAAAITTTIATGDVIPHDISHDSTSEDETATGAPRIDGGEQDSEVDVDNPRLIMATSSGMVKSSAGAAADSVVAHMGSVVAEAEVALWVETAILGFVPSACVRGSFIDGPLASPQQHSEGGKQMVPASEVVAVATTPGTPCSVDAIGRPSMVGEVGKMGENDEMDVPEEGGCPTVRVEQADALAEAFTPTDGVTTESKPVAAVTAVDYPLPQEGVVVHDASAENDTESRNETLCEQLRNGNGSGSRTDTEDGPPTPVTDPGEAPSTPKKCSGLIASNSQYPDSEQDVSLGVIEASVSSGSVLSSMTETEERWLEDERPTAEAEGPVESGLSRRLAADQRWAEEASYASDVESSASRVKGWRILCVGCSFRAAFLSPFPFGGWKFPRQSQALVQLRLVCQAPGCCRLSRGTSL